MATDAAGRRRSRYAADPLCLLGIVAYWVNRWWIKPTAWGHAGLVHDHLNDVLLIPVFLPPVLWVHRQLRLRGDDRPPTAGEVAGHVTLWSACFLIAFPHAGWHYRHSTADPWNAVAYAAGGAAAWAVWH